MKLDKRGKRPRIFIFDKANPRFNIERKYWLTGSLNVLYRKARRFNIYVAWKAMKSQIMLELLP